MSSVDTNVISLRDQLLERCLAEAFISAELGIPVEMIGLENAARNGTGPAFRKWGRKALYRRPDLIAWATNRLGHPKIRSGNGGQ